MLAVEDDGAMFRFYADFFERLHRDEFDARLVTAGEEALDALRAAPGDLVVLDWALPGLSGATLVRALRADPRTRTLGVLMVTARSDPADAVLALDAGADDYLAKPFDARVLLARLRSLARRRALSLDRAVARRWPGLELDAAAGRLTVGGRPVPLTPKEMSLLTIFLDRPNILHTREFLWRELWGYESDGWAHVLHATISSLRRKLGARWGGRLSVQKGVGYLFEP